MGVSSRVGAETGGAFREEEGGGRPEAEREGVASRRRSDRRGRSWMALKVYGRILKLIANLTGSQRSRRRTGGWRGGGRDAAEWVVVVVGCFWKR